MALSKKQNKRLGAILSVMFEEDTPKEHLQEIVKEGFVSRNGDKFAITPKGIDEKNRLCTLAGLNIKYSTEKNTIAN
mgnify:CR=1 FL=1|tara:strand:+ start:1150 stop:1380 length:231 start_codon:yes stop_codon:yes gene_type:complete